MFRGAWHQCGDRSQKLVEEQLRNGIGGGVIISPRDLSRARAIEYAASYRGLGAEVLLDHQFHVPAFLNPRLNSYPISTLRGGISTLHRISDSELNDFASHLRTDHQELGATGVLAPAVLYEAGRLDIVQLNARLFNAAKQVGDSLGLPTFATIVLGRSVGASEQTIGPILSAATALNSDGWYFAFEFEDERLPSNREAVRRSCGVGLTLACTGKPVLHGYAGPLGLLSFGFGATGIGIGHAQNTWRFDRDRWQPAVAQGGGGDAPPRFFSTSLWGTIIYPDETALLSAAIRQQVLTLSPFSTPVGAAGLAWDRWGANKHLVFSLGQTFGTMAAQTNARTNAQSAIDRLQQAVALHATIQAAGTFLGDGTNSYQQNWLLAMQDILRDRSGDYDYLELLP
jgi:hypothetical protein